MDFEKRTVTETVATDKTEQRTTNRKIVEFELGSNLSWVAAGTLITLITLTKCNDVKDYILEKDKNDVQKGRLEYLNQAAKSGVFIADSTLDKFIRVADSSNSAKR